LYLSVELEPYVGEPVKYPPALSCAVPFSVRLLAFVMPAAVWKTPGTAFAAFTVTPPAPETVTFRFVGLAGHQVSPLPTP
jgi:hypothetical protein